MFIRFYLILITAVAGLLANGCSKGCKNLESSNEGSISNSYSFGACDFFSALDSNLIITTQTQFNDFVNSRMSTCTSKNAIPAIDFNVHSLIANMIKTPGCNAAFHRKVQIDHTAKKYVYSISVEVCTGCNTQIANPNYVLVPAIPAGYTVQFEKK